MPHLLSRWAAEEHVLHWFHWLWAIVRTTLVNFCQDSSMPFIHCHCLVNNWPKNGHFFLCLSFVPNDIPSRWSGWGNFIMPLMWNWLLKDLLRSNPLPPHLVRVSKERSNLQPPPTCRIKEELIKFPKEQVELGLATSTCHSIHPNTQTPSWENHWWCYIFCIWLHPC